MRRYHPLDNRISKSVLYWYQGIAPIIQDGSALLNANLERLPRMMKL